MGTPGPEHHQKRPKRILRPSAEGVSDAARLLDPVPWVSAVCLFALSFVFGVAADEVIPRLFDWLDRAPRLAMLGLLAFFVSPALVVAVLHRAMHAVLARREPPLSANATPPLASAWAGAFAWLVMFSAGLLAVLILLVIEPPEPDEAKSALLAALPRVFANDVSMGAHVAVWIAVAALFFTLERHGRDERGERVRQA